MAKQLWDLWIIEKKTGTTKVVVKELTRKQCEKHKKPGEVYFDVPSGFLNAIVESVCDSIEEEEACQVGAFT